MLDLSQFKRSEEEVRAQIEAKQALISEIIKEKAKKKVKFMPIIEMRFEKKARNRTPFPELQNRDLVETYAPHLMGCKRLDKYDKV